MSVSSSPSSAPRYQRLDGVEHVLRRPDTYVGSVAPAPALQWVLRDDGGGALERREVTASPALLKIVDEILVNAADNKQRDAATSRVDVDVDVESGGISVSNNGRSLPLDAHPTELDKAGKPMRIPELVFGSLLSGENFDDHEKRTVGGRNGLGAKLANIFSQRFEVSLVSDEATAGGDARRRSYTQVWTANMGKVEPPVLRASRARQTRTTITFEPELGRFGMRALDAGTVALLRRRAFDLAACMGKASVFFNGEKVPVGSFAQYCRLAAPDAVVEELGERWTVGVAPGDGAALQHLSFVNCIATSKGGTHVEAVADAVAKSLKKALAKKVGALRPAQIKQQLFVFVRCLVENPAFSSQTKEELTTRPADFGSAPEFASEKGKRFLARLARGKVGDAVAAWAQRKAAAADERELSKVGGARRQTVRVEKLEDANYAGGRKAQECTLILTEGDSAAALAIAGLTVVGRDRYGVFPLKGKPLNVRDAGAKTVAGNAEVQNLVKILGLQFGTRYDDERARRTLRYGKLMIMADQDVDGSHIKGLIINMLDHFWPSLLSGGFLQQFITPIVKARRGAETKVFHTLTELTRWRDALPPDELRRFTLKYYKGLGTSTAAEAKEYFGRLERSVVPFEFRGAADTDKIDMAFAKKRAADRKAWLQACDPSVAADYAHGPVAYEAFVDYELVHFSRYDNVRSIPSAVDGLKPSQRKVLFGCFKRNLTSEMKVAQLAGYVAEHSAYHHGEQSLTATIVNMATTYVGANNANLLFPSGQFGTRDKGGKDAASPRYIFTRLEPIARALFPEADDALLPQQEDDGQPIEPAFYAPTIPLALVNGCDGIGTGWSTYVPPHDPLEVIDRVRKKLAGEPMTPLAPWWRGFVGEVEVDGAAVRVRGACARLADGSVEVTELPIRTWTQGFKQHLEKLAEAGTIASFANRSDDRRVRFVVHGLAPDAEPHAVLKLESRVLTSNMHLFGADGKIQKFETALEVLEEWFPTRLALYAKRRAALIAQAEALATASSEKARFIDAVRAEEVDLRAACAAVEARLAELGFGEPSPLLAMKLSALTEENAAELRRAAARAQRELEALRATTPEAMWRADLDALQALLRDDAAPDPAAKRARR